MGKSKNYLKQKKVRCIRYINNKLYFVFVAIEFNGNVAMGSMIWMVLPVVAMGEFHLLLLEMVVHVVDTVKSVVGTQKL